MRIVGIENVVCDYYFWEEHIYINGGGTVSNILVNLDSYGIPCKLIGYCGNDAQGKWILNSLRHTNIDTSDIKEINARTKCFYIDKIRSSTICPICGKKKKKYPNEKVENILRNIKKEDILLIKDYSKINEKIIQNVKNDILIDMGYIKPLLYLDKETIKKFIYFPYLIVSIKEELLLFIAKKLGQPKEKILNDMKANLIVITKGKKGVEFIYQKKQYAYSLKEPYKEIETNGCGDAFFSIVIKEILNNPEIQEKMFSHFFEMGNKLVKVVLKEVGARNHVIPNGKMIGYKDCLCDKIKIK